VTLPPRERYSTVHLFVSAPRAFVVASRVDVAKAVAKADSILDFAMDASEADSVGTVSPWLSPRLMC
jgi:hypothetical protein